MSDLRKAAEMALDVLRQSVGHSNQSQTRIDDAKHALVQALAQPEQEPVAWVDITDGGKWSVRFAVPALSLPDGTKFYTAPPKREWVSATHIEIGNLWAQHKEVYGFAMALDKLLQDKNR